MIEGVGIDLVEVERIAGTIGRNSGFREHVFSAAEIVYCESKKNRFEHYAARFAAKEAFFKALGTGWAEGTQFNEVETIHDENGKPIMQLLGETQKNLAFLNIIKISVSLSHVKSMATAIVIIER
ncbi:holo-ACP synthase [Danxiaibacter flavus]|uniref:Holo-[acyl-carrier-protein] synthase n=1 Tax=Danxiaibacter flavus TaxID=3049108 RepID=A0ABV3ZE07_9BACT|nr:holo-ACP synthase [Chitinophagaceae bacterium DXS]